MRRGCRENLIRYLLVICIGLAPAISPGAAEMQPVNHAAGGCPDCMQMEGASGSGCETETCMPVSHACGANFHSGLITGDDPGIGKRLYLVCGESPGAAPFRSRRAQMIFRPPIA